MEYIVELKNELYFTVTEKMAEEIDRTDGFVIIQGNHINKSNIKGIWTKEAWEDLYPDRKFIQPTTEVHRLQNKASRHQEVWLECIELNKDRVINKQQPKWKVNSNGKIVEAEDGYFNKRPDEKITTTWVKMRVSDKKYSSFYAQSPGYHLLDKLDNGAIIAFIWPDANGVPPSHVEKCNELEVKKLEG